MCIFVLFCKFWRSYILWPRLSHSNNLQGYLNFQFFTAPSFPGGQWPSASNFSCLANSYKYFMLWPWSKESMEIPHQSKTDKIQGSWLYSLFLLSECKHYCRKPQLWKLELLLRSELPTSTGSSNNFTFSFILTTTISVHALLCCCLGSRSCSTLCDPRDCSLPAPLSMGFPTQEY